MTPPFDMSLSHLPPRPPVAVSSIDRTKLPRDVGEAATLFALLPAGGAFIYHVGCLASDRCGNPALSRIAREVLELTQSGLARLTQERADAFGVWVYRCHKALPPRGSSGDRHAAPVAKVSVGERPAFAGRRRVL